MSKDRVIDSLGRIDDDMIRGVEGLRGKKKRLAKKKWVALAACLCLMVVFAIPTVFRQPAESPNDTIASSDGPSSLVVNGKKYLISSYLAVSDELPDGFVHAGEADIGGLKGCLYFINPDVPEWVYVYQEVMTDGTVDATGTLNRTDPHNAYVRYVDIRLRGKDIVCYNGEYYISMWSAEPSGDSPDVSNEYFDTMEGIYGIRIEGAYEVYVNPNEPDVILVSTQWHTAPVGENGEKDHSGFNVYIRYNCPLA